MKGREGLTISSDQEIGQKIRIFGLDGLRVVESKKFLSKSLRKQSIQNDYLFFIRSSRIIEISLLA